MSLQVLTATLAAGAVVALAALRRPASVVRAPAPRPRVACAPTRRPRLSPSQVVGHHLAVTLRLPIEAQASKRLGSVVLGAVPLVIVVPPLGLGVIALVCLHARLDAIRSAAAHERAVLRALPDLIDHLLLCVGGGLSLALAHPLVASAAAPALAPALSRADEAAAAGTPRADALERALRPLGPRATMVAEALAIHLRYGTPLAPALERLRLELRLDRRRAAETEARRIPVQMLGPLVLCTLPAFALLTVVPLLAASVRSLPT